MRTVSGALVCITAAGWAGGGAIVEAAAPSKRASHAHPVDAGAAAGDSSHPGVEHPLDITADHLTVFTKENRTVWTGHVHVVRPSENGQPPVDIHCHEMKTTAVSASDAGAGGEGNQKVDKVYCHGDVEIVQGDKSGSGDDAVFDNVAGIATVTGGATGNRPKAKDGDSHYEADRITFLVDNNQLQMSGHVIAVVPAAQSGLRGSAHADGGAALDGGRR